MPLGNDKEAKVALEAQEHGKEIMQAAREKREKERVSLINTGFLDKKLYDDLGEKIARYRYIQKHFGLSETKEYFKDDKSFKSFMGTRDIVWFQRIAETEFTMPKIKDLNI